MSKEKHVHYVAGCNLGVTGHCHVCLFAVMQPSVLIDGQKISMPLLANLLQSYI